MPALMQGAELALLQQQQQYRRVIYCGDGQNDLCPVLRLSAGDVVLARTGFGLHKLLAFSDHTCKASVRLWSTAAEMADLLCQYTSEDKSGK